MNCHGDDYSKWQEACLLVMVPQSWEDIGHSPNIESIVNSATKRSSRSCWRSSSRADRNLLARPSSHSGSRRKKDLDLHRDGRPTTFHSITHTCWRCQIPTSLSN